MDRRIKGLKFSFFEKRRARKIKRAELLEDLNLYLYSVFCGLRDKDAELLKSSKKDLYDTERLFICKTFAECVRSDVGTVEGGKKNGKQKGK